ncbi:nucleophosmin-like [Ambystoma mexicanum]|uniref:nucleophosmin-like n=1 Tax=Ambystoma mexicanum TaxID=8296 RepID=UPI0037E9A36B
MAVKQSPSTSRRKLHVCFFGFQLREDKKEYHCNVGKDCKEHLILRTMCLDASAREEQHIVVIEALHSKRKQDIVHLASLRPNVANTVNLGGYAVTLPVTFRLTSGSGPVYISGQHFIALPCSAVEQVENNSSPIKRPSKRASALTSDQPNTKNLHFYDHDTDGTDDDGSDIYEVEVPILPAEIIDLTVTDDNESFSDSNKPESPKPKSPKPESPKSEDTSSSEDSSDENRKIIQKVITWNMNRKSLEELRAPEKDLSLYRVNPKEEEEEDDDDEEGCGMKQLKKSRWALLSRPRPRPPLSTETIKARIWEMMAQGMAMPKDMQAFSNFAFHSFRLRDQNALNELWLYKECLRTRMPQ